jgi:glycosyltransferase involved in cell wall biosynthesis
MAGRGRFAGATLMQVTPRLNEGGVERATLEISRAFVQAGGRSLVASEGGRLEDQLQREGGELWRIRAASKNPLVIGANAGRIARFAEANGVALLHARSRAPAWSAYWAAQRLKIPLVTTYHGVYGGSGLKQAYNAVMAKGQVVIANSDYTRRHILETYAIDPERVVTIDRGIDLGVFTAPDPAKVEALRRAWAVSREGTIFLLPARLTRWKGQAVAIEALKRVSQPCTLVIAGEGKAAYERELRRAAPHNVRLVGHVGDMASAYGLADVVLVPSLKPEAFGRTAVEPQAMSRPVLASATGAMTDTVEDGVTGWLVPPGDVQAWAEAMQQACLTPPDVRAWMGAAGRARVEARYTLAQMAAKTLDVYGRLLGR